jgi:hypothetical protein
VRADLHVHSYHSRDAVARPEALARAARERGIDALALTDHDSCDGWEEMEEACAREGLLFVRGVERKVRFEGRFAGDLLCLFLRRPVRASDLLEVAAEVREQGGILSAAHPFDGRRAPFRGLALLLASGEALLEARNGRDYLGVGNRRALAFAAERGIAVTAGSDAHTPYEVGSVWVSAPAFDLEGLRRALLAGQGMVGGRASSPVWSLCSWFGRAGLKLG